MSQGHEFELISLKQNLQAPQSSVFYGTEINIGEDHGQNSKKLHI